MSCDRHVKCPATSLELQPGKNSRAPGPPIHPSASAAALLPGPPSVLLWRSVTSRLSGLMSVCTMRAAKRSHRSQAGRPSVRQGRAAAGAPRCAGHAGLQPFGVVTGSPSSGAAPPAVLRRCLTSVQQLHGAQQVSDQVHGQGLGRGLWTA